MIIGIGAVARRLVWLALTGFLFFGSTPALPPAQHENHQAHMIIGWVPQDILERPVVLRKEIGNAHEKVTTGSSQAQAFYDQGLNYLDSYVWIEAARSFNQALRLDPNLGAVYEGLCDVYVAMHDNKAARAALEKGRSLL